MTTQIKPDSSGYGAAVTIIDPDKRVIGISRDFPRHKVFEPA